MNAESPHIPRLLESKYRNEESPKRALILLRHHALFYYNHRNEESPKRALIRF